MRRLHATALTLTLAAAVSYPAVAQNPQLPRYLPKPNTWISNLVTHDNDKVKDRDFAGWIKNAQMVRPFSFVGTFTQCFGGGFLEELAIQNVAPFGANSAGRYYEPVSYAAQNSYYAFAWQHSARVAQGANPPTDKKITLDAHLALGDGVQAVPDNPNRGLEHPQYRSSLMGDAALEPLHAATHNFAILFAGQPDGRDKKDVDQIYDRLRTTYKYGILDIYILYGDGNQVNGAAWFNDARATAANLQAAINTWLGDKLRELNDDQDHGTVQVFFWAGDHGNADSPIAISVDNASIGVAGSHVAMLRAAGFAVGRGVYEANNGTNRFAWNTPNFDDVDALSFGDDLLRGADDKRLRDLYQYPAKFIAYFSPDWLSTGKAGSGVAREIGRNFPAATDVFVASHASNRQLSDGKRNLGLDETMFPFDEVDALNLRNVLAATDPNTMMLGIPVHYSVHGTAELRTWEPLVNGWTDYIYYDWTDFPATVGAPDEVDALVLIDDGARDMQTGNLSFKADDDYILFSVGRGETKAFWKQFKPCDILRLKPGMVNTTAVVWRGCADLGLDPERDNLDALDIGRGEDNEPVPFPSYPDSYPDPDPDGPHPPEPETEPEPDTAY